MKTLKLGFCIMDEEGNIISKKQIGADWEVDLTQEPRPQWEVYQKKCLKITQTLADTFRTQFKREDVSEVLDDVRAKCNFENE
jgi:hypothetical protein